MRATPRLLLIGTSRQQEALRRVLPGAEVLVTENPLEGVWQSGRRDFDGAYVSLASGQRALRAVHSLRKLSPELRIVVGCDPSEEPIARESLDSGADEYVIEPLRREDVESAFGLTPSTPPTEPTISPVPTVQEILGLGEVLRNLNDGALATLDRLTTLVQETFDASGVVLELDELSCTAGDTSDLVLEDVIKRNNKPVGQIALGRRRHNRYGTDAAERLREYARLIEAAIVQARERERWRELAWTDDLSGLYNRRYFDSMVDELLAYAAEKRLRVTVLLFDIDDFKSYNDNYGHDTGDKLIREVGELLKRCSRGDDIVVRYGGDEFAVVFWDAEKQRVPGSAHPQEPTELAARFCNAISEQRFDWLGSDAPGPVTISGGLACFPWHGNTRDELVNAADQALLSAKRTGKNRIHLAGATYTEPAEPTAQAE